MTTDYTPVEQSRSEPRQLSSVPNPYKRPEGRTVSFYNIRLKSTVKGFKWANREKLELMRPSGQATIFYGFKLFGFKVLFGHDKFNYY